MSDFQKRPVDSNLWSRGKKASKNERWKRTTREGGTKIKTRIFLCDHARYFSRLKGKFLMSDQPYAGMYAVCPVCNKRILLEKQAKAFLRISHLVPWFLSHQALLEAVVKGSFHDSHSGRDKIHWACDDCIELERALLANPAEQTFCDSAPYYAYFDLCFDCRTCGKRFQFSAREQKFWYETRKFWVQSQPKDCVECRRERRKRKQRHSPKENTGDNNDLRTDSA